MAEAERPQSFPETDKLTAELLSYDVLLTNNQQRNCQKYRVRWKKYEYNKFREANNYGFL